MLEIAKILVWQSGCACALEGGYICKLSEMGFKAGVASTDCFYREDLQVRCVDEDADLDQIQSEMRDALLRQLRNRFDDGREDLKQARVLDRVITWQPAYG